MLVTTNALHKVLDTLHLHRGTACNRARPVYLTARAGQAWAAEVRLANKALPDRAQAPSFAGQRNTSSSSSSSSSNDQDSAAGITDDEEVPSYIDTGYRKLEQLKAEDVPFAVKVLNVVPGGLVTSFEGLRCFVPMSLVGKTGRAAVGCAGDRGDVEKLKGLIGTSIPVRAVDVVQAQRKIILTNLGPEDTRDEESISSKNVVFLQKMREYQAQDTPFLARVVEAMPSGLKVMVGGHGGFVPMSLLGKDAYRTPGASESGRPSLARLRSTMVGTFIHVRVMSIDEERGSVVLTNQELFTEDLKADAESSGSERPVKGSLVVTARVKGAVEAGLLLEYSGAEGLLPYSSFSPVVGRRLPHISLTTELVSAIGQKFMDRELAVEPVEVDQGTGGLVFRLFDPKDSNPGVVSTLKDLLETGATDQEFWEIITQLRKSRSIVSARVTGIRGASLELTYEGHTGKLPLRLFGKGLVAQAEAGRLKELMGRELPVRVIVAVQAQGKLVFGDAEALMKDKAN